MVQSSAEDEVYLNEVLGRDQMSDLKRTNNWCFIIDSIKTGRQSERAYGVQSLLPTWLQTVSRADAV